MCRFGRELFAAGPGPGLWARRARSGATEAERMGNLALSTITPDFSAQGPSHLGLELELFAFDARTLAPLGTRDAALSSQDLLRRVSGLVPGCRLKFDEATEELIGLELGCGNFSLEPGGQLEYASCPQTSLEGVLADLTEGLRLLEEAGREEILFLDHGTNPVAGPDLPLLVPKLRYQILDRYFASQPGGRGVHMMRYSATAQPNVDVTGREAWLDAVNLTFALTPLARALFANSRYFHGRRVGPGSERQRIWAAIDPSRTGIPAGVPFSDDLPSAYADWARRAHVFLVSALPPEQQPLFGELTFEQWEREGYQGTRPTTQDWATHLATLFPDLRLRNFLEIRMVDAQPFEHALAPMAFWALALQEEENRARLWAYLGSLAQSAGLRQARELLQLSADDELFRQPRHLQGVLQCLECPAGSVAERSLSKFARWLEQREELPYPESGVDFVREWGTLHPSRQLQSLLQV